MKIIEMSLRPYFAALEAAATEINPFLVVVAIGLGVLNLALFMCQRHYATHTTAAGQVAYTPPCYRWLSIEEDRLRLHQCPPALAPELQEMLNHD